MSLKIVISEHCILVCWFIIVMQFIPGSLQNISLTEIRNFKAKETIELAKIIEDISVGLRTAFWADRSEYAYR